MTNACSNLNDFSHTSSSKKKKKQEQYGISENEPSVGVDTVLDSQTIFFGNLVISKEAYDKCFKVQEERSTQRMQIAYSALSPSILNLCYVAERVPCYLFM